MSVDGAAIPLSPRPPLRELWGHARTHRSLDPFSAVRVRCYKDSILSRFVHRGMNFRLGIFGGTRGRPRCEYRTGRDDFDEGRATAGQRVRKAGTSGARSN